MEKSIKLTSKLYNAKLHKQRVFLRADLNVIVKNGRIQGDHRLKEILPTINLIQKKGGKVILATHRGRPKNKEENLSTAHLLPWFQEHGYTIDFESDLIQAQEKSTQHFKRILLLENLRFFSGEKSVDQKFVDTLAQLADYYVNDAFGLMHRTDSSIRNLPKRFAQDKRTIGLLVEKELHMLNSLLKHPQHPFVLIIGGAKISGKLPLLHSFISYADTILICPAIAFTFLKALGKPVGKSLVDESLLSQSKEILDRAQQYNTKIIFPVDYQVADGTFNGSLSYITTPNIGAHQFGVSIGHKTTQLFAEEIAQAKTIFLNGAIGNPQRKESLEGMHSILTALVNSQAKTIVGGGDTVAVVDQFEMRERIDFCSTGGGATLAYLSGEKMPGLRVFTQ